MGTIDTGGLTTLERARAAARKCKACPLYARATQTVFGEGPNGAPVMLVGEQPGDQEDRHGRPFVGPSGRLLDQALEAAGLDRADLYVTNAVKHFKWEPVRKLRLHKKPNASEIGACRPWLDLELALVRPRVVVALGATAAQALMGAAFRVTRSRGRRFTVPWASAFMATVHPSSVLRAPAGERERQQREFFRDIAKVPSFL
jgi:uracil-DNA glycosylase family protein